jgi:APA family basic amino acid/polyamine antiporter
LLALTAASRNMYGMARSGSLPGIIATLGHTQSPWLAALIGFCVAAVFAMTADIGLAASVTDVAVYAIFVVVNVAVIVLRRTHADAPRTFTVPLSPGRVPITALLAIVAVAMMAWRLERDAWLLGSAAIAAGMVAWLLLRLARSRAPEGRA